MSILRIRKTAPQDPLIVSIAGVRLGQRVLAIAGRDLRPTWELAARVGLTGRMLALVADDDAAARATADALKGGVLADVAVLEIPLPIAEDQFDLALVDDTATRTSEAATPTLLPYILRALRPGGRVIVMLREPTRLLARWLGGGNPPDVDPTLEGLREAGFRAGRLVTVRQGVGFVEAVRPAD
jgi:SAM-dependent methyltransferase